ncbi:MAG: GspE/PulE family protein [Rhodothermia bacterium]|nr:GspE/PulE family protein [Rhodothermia bacterium]
MVSDNVVRDAHEDWKSAGEIEPLWRVLAKQKSVDQETVFGAVARIYGFRKAEIGEGRPESDFVERIIHSFDEEQRVRFGELALLPIEYKIEPEKGILRLVFATPDPTSPETLRFIHDMNLDQFEVTYAPYRDLSTFLDDLFPKRNEYLDRLASDTDADATDIGLSYAEEGTQLVDEDALDAEINRSALINLFEACLVEAVRQGASDIHVLPNPRRQTEFRFRIDGALRIWHTHAKTSPEAMLAVVKDRCGNIDRFEREAAQDGFIQRDVDGSLIRYRVSVLPVANANRTIRAESIVIRVLDDRKVFTDLSQIGLLPGALERYKKAIAKPHGMIIMTGPTGSGKSTTLVAALQEVAKPELNVITVEDPVEYVIPAIRQIKLGPRLHMEQALRAILRHDPDIVMVGEMRDRETAELAIKLANTGHLTFSTLHTNDAPSAVSRLYKMGIEPFLLAYAINIVVAQRLLRKLCPECKEVDDDPDTMLMSELGFSDEEVQNTTFYKAGSRNRCKSCNGMGYKGRRAISEALYVTKAIRQLIVSAGETVDEDAIRDTAISEGMLTLMASAREVAKMGETSVEEIIRVTTQDD